MAVERAQHGARLGGEQFQQYRLLFIKYRHSTHDPRH
jgi:hypothetical protein